MLVMTIVDTAEGDFHQHHGLDPVIASAFAGASLQRSFVGSPRADERRTGVGARAVPDGGHQGVEGMTRGIDVSIRRGALGDQPTPRRVLVRGLVELVDVGPEGGGVLEDEPALLRCRPGQRVNVDRGLAVHRRDDREAVVGTGDRAHAVLIEQDAIDVDSGKVGFGAERRDRRAVHHAGARGGHQGPATQHQRS
jgi:hypothetical protein